MVMTEGKDETDGMRGIRSNKGTDIKECRAQ